jgi:hypothetical protein
MDGPFYFSVLQDCIYGNADIAGIYGEETDVVLVVDCIQRENCFVNACERHDAYANGNNIGGGNLRYIGFDPGLPLHENVSIAV